MLTTWRAIVQREYPNCQDLLDLLPKPNNITLAKLALGGWIMTDTCNPARKFCRLFKEAIRKIAKESDMTDKDIKIYEAGK